MLVEGTILRRIRGERGTWLVEERPMNEPPRVVIIHAIADPGAAPGPVEWAIGQLREALTRREQIVLAARSLDEVSPEATTVLVAGGDQSEAREFLRQIGHTSPSGAEALALASNQYRGRAVTLASGSDRRGLVYAVLELADRVACASDPRAALHVERPIFEQPANPIRSVARLFASDVEDKPWFDDRDFWRAYLSMLVTHRFNRFHLAFGMGHDFLRGVKDAYLLFAYPFLVSVPGYDVRAVGLADAERAANLETLRFISDEAKARGLHFQLGLWTHGYQWIDSPNANFLIAGLNAENHAAYCRDALRTLLQACPSIDGVTLRVHGESGVPEGSYGFWKTVFQGAVECGRRIDLDLHPKGLDRELLGIALATGLPVTISPKYTAEHQGLPYQQAAIRELERVSRPAEGDSFVRNLMNRSAGDLRYTRYGYADFLEKDRPYGVYFRIWPGTQRLLLWGDPALAAGFGRHASFAGGLGVDYCEPLSFKGRRGSGSAPRDPYVDASLRPAGGDWEKYAYTYRLLGRLLYNPDSDPEVWRRYLRHAFGEAALPAEEALANASRILPLVTTAFLVSAANNRFWPEMYTSIPIVDASRPHPYGDTPSPKRLGTVSPLDPALFARVDDFADEVASGQRSGKYSPLRVARWLDGQAEAATRNLDLAEARATGGDSPAFRRLAIDVRIQAGLGHFFANLLRAGVGYALYQRTESIAWLGEALDAYRAARSAWVAVAADGRAYRDDVAIGGEPWLRGHWADRLAAIDGDLADMEAVYQRASAANTAGALLPSGETTLAELDRDIPAVNCVHTPPRRFTRGRPVTIELALDDPSITPRLRYRPVNQAETYRAATADGQDGAYRFAIPAADTDSPYALQYFFELRRGPSEAWLEPGFAADLANQPYYVIMQAD